MPAQSPNALDRILLSLKLKKSEPALTREQAMQAWPVRNPALQVQVAEDGLITIELPRRKDWMGGVLGFMFSVPQSKPVQLDEVGSFVWNLCDGDHTVSDIVGELVNEYKLNRREVEVSLTKYLQTLGQRGMVGFAVPREVAEAAGLAGEEFAVAVPANEGARAVAAPVADEDTSDMPPVAADEPADATLAELPPPSEQPDDQNILVGYNGQRGSAVAFRLAAGLAQAGQARLHLAYVEPMVALKSVPVPSEVSADAYPPLLPDTTAPPPEDPSEVPSIFDDIADQCREERLQCTFSHLYGDAGTRLSELARLAGLVAIGRHDDMPTAGEPPLGRVARQIATRMAAPLLLAAREFQEIKGVTLVYEPTQIGGRALALAGEIAHLQNLTLNAVALGYEQIEPAVAAQEARLALRAYHVEGDMLPLPTVGPEALQTATLTWNDALLVLAAPPKGWLSRPLDSIRPALALPNLNVLLVP